MDYQKNSESKWGVSHIISVKAFHINNIAVSKWEEQEYGKVSQQSPKRWNRVNPLTFSSTNASEQRVSQRILCCHCDTINIVSWQPAVLVCGMFHNHIYKHARCCRATLATHLLCSRCSAPRCTGGSCAPPAPAEIAAHTLGAGWTKPRGEGALLDSHTFNHWKHFKTIGEDKGRENTPKDSYDCSRYDFRL